MLTKISHSRFILALLLLAVAAQAARPQDARKQRDARSPVQSIAVETLESASYELREVADLAARVALTRDVVKLLANKRPARCRQLLESLFDDALKSRQDQDDKAAGGSGPDGVLQKTIAIAAGFDPKLAQAFAERYAKSVDDEGANAAPRASYLSADVYLGLAAELIDRDPALAASVAERSLAAGVYPKTLAFLEALRRKDVSAADRFLSSALESVSSRKGNDVTELFLLYAYVFSPGRVPLVVSGQLRSYQIPEYNSVAQKRPVDARAARRFLQVAAQLMLNPARLETGTHQLAAGVEGDLYLLQIIEPLAKIHLPSAAASLAARRLHVAQYLSQNQRESLQASIDRWRDSPADALAEAKGSATLEDQLRRAEEMSDPDQKDRIYYDAASTAVSERRYDAALDIADKMSLKSREQARQLISFSVALEEIKAGRLEKAEQIAARDTDPARRAFLLNNLARAFAKGEQRDFAKATEILNEVESIAAKLEAGAEKVSTLAGASVVFYGFDSVRSAELFREAIRAANKLEKFTGEAGVNRAIEIAGFVYVYNLYDDELTFSEAVRRQGRKDFYSALSEAQNLKDRVARLRAIIDLCQAVISGPPRES